MGKKNGSNGQGQTRATTAPDTPPPNAQRGHGAETTATATKTLADTLRERAEAVNHKRQAAFLTKFDVDYRNFTAAIAACAEEGLFGATFHSTDPALSGLLSLYGDAECCFRDDVQARLVENGFRVSWTEGSLHVAWGPEPEKKTRRGRPKGSKNAPKVKPDASPADASATSSATSSTESAVT